MKSGWVGGLVSGRAERLRGWVDGWRGVGGWQGSGILLAINNQLCVARHPEVGANMGPWYEQSWHE